VLAAISLLTALICFFKVFYSPTRKPLGENEYEIPKGEIYEPFREQMVNWVKDVRAMPHEDMEIVSHDGLALRGRYYECNPGAPIELLFHGYQGNSERDLSGGVARCFALGRNALIIDHRAAGRSAGHVITFGIREHLDCLAWAAHAVRRFGPDCRLILTGISMGAATVMMAAGKPLPPQVVCVLADCGYTSPREIIEKVIRDMRLPPRLLYPFVRLGARLFGRFDLEANSPIEAVKRARVPLILIHGDADAFVPCEMSERLYGLCTSEHKAFSAVSGAGHGLAFAVDREGYLRALREFAEECGF
jgi:fermentation-respiration switch protein FrsA (DUF1100 family)